MRVGTRTGLLSALLQVLALTAAPAQEPAPLNWTGLYIGYHTGGALGLADVANPFGPSIFGDTVAPPVPLPAASLATTGSSARMFSAWRLTPAGPTWTAPTRASPLAAIM